MDEREARKQELIREIRRMGYPQELGEAIAIQLGGEKSMARMLGYLRHARPRSAEEIVDEMLAIQSDVQSWVKKKEAERANTAYNELLWYGLGTEDEED